MLSCKTRGHYEGVRLYWTPNDINAVTNRLSGLGYTASGIVDREYGQAEFFVTTMTATPIVLG